MSEPRFPTQAWLAIGLWFLVGTAAFAQGPRTTGTEAMVQRLAEISRTADLRRNSFLNSRRVQMIRSVGWPVSFNSQCRPGYP